MINLRKRTIINTSAPNGGALQYVRPVLKSVKGEINSSIIRVGDLTIPLTTMDRLNKQKIS